MDTLKFIILLILIDSIWLLGKYELHKTHFEKIQKSPMKIDKVAGILFYIVGAIAYFNFVKPTSRSKEEAFRKGFLHGFIIYASFDLTNKAIFTDYTWEYAIKDILWGSIAFGSVSYLMY